MPFTSPLKAVFQSYTPLSENELSPQEDEKDFQASRRSIDLESNGSISSHTSTLLDSTQAEPKRKFQVDARVISDAIIGLSDGLTVPFALTAGLSALGDTKVVIYGGLAELTAGAISMGLGGYLGAKSEEESYKATERETRDSILTGSSSVLDDLSAIFASYDVPSPIINDLTTHLCKSSKLVEFLMHFQHRISEPPSSRAFTCALTIALGYFVGGFIPLLPYFFVASDNIWTALGLSIGIMVVALFAFGYVKTCFVQGWQGSRNVMLGIVGGFQMVLVGGVAAGVAMGLVKGFNALSER